jgi:hypothetical protein
MMKRPSLPKNDPLCVLLTARISKSGHPIRAHHFDLRALRDGRKAQPGKTEAYSGRPLLAAQICSADRREMLSRASRQTVAVFFWAHSYFFRFLDVWEAANPGQLVDDVGSINGQVWEEFSVYLAADEYRDFAYQVYDLCSKSLKAALRAEGLDELPNNPFPSRTKTPKRRLVDSPYAPELERDMITAFRHTRKAVLERINSSHLLADTGDDPAKTLKRAKSCQRGSFNVVWTKPNILRFVRERLIPVMTNFAEFNDLYEFRAHLIGIAPDAIAVKPDGYVKAGARTVKKFGTGDGLGALYRNLLPTHIDLVAFVAELVFVHGWNLQSVIDIDRTNYFEKTGPETCTIFSRKIRAGGKYVESESGFGPDSAFAIIQAAIGITQPLHDYVLRELARLNALPENHRTDDVLTRIGELTSMQNRVWLTLRLLPLDVAQLSYSTSNFWGMANSLLALHNVKENGQPVKWSGRRVRDGYADDHYVASGFRVEAVQAALHHANVAQSDDYLEHPSGKDREIASIHECLETLATMPLSNSAEPGNGPTEHAIAIGGMFILADQAHAWLQATKDLDDPMLLYLRDAGRERAPR